MERLDSCISTVIQRAQDKAANQAFFAGEHAQVTKEAADLLLEIGTIKAIPDLKSLADTSFIK